MQTALRGINLGGWLIAEKWMTPELFEGVSGPAEADFTCDLGRDGAEKRLNKHRRAFITEKDFAWIARQGFDVVRLPVGYWLFEEDQDFISGSEYADVAFKWAERYKLGVILDFHGLQGSQNGYDHSGRVGKVRFYRRKNMKAALTTLEKLAINYGHKKSLVAIEVINEPKIRLCAWRLFRYYKRACAILERRTKEDVKIIVSDAFKPLRLAKALSRRNYSPRLVLDMHLYQVFDKTEQYMTFEQHLDKVAEWRQLLITINQYVPVMVGEWSAALPKSAYDGLAGGEKANAWKYYEAQRKLFDELAWAHCYWSYKARGAGVWSWRDAKVFLLKDTAQQV